MGEELIHVQMSKVEGKGSYMYRLYACLLPWLFLHCFVIFGELISLPNSTVTNVQ